MNKPLQEVYITDEELNTMTIESECGHPECSAGKTAMNFGYALQVFCNSKMHAAIAKINQRFGTNITYEQVIANLQQELEVAEQMEALKQHMEAVTLTQLSQKGGGNIIN